MAASSPIAELDSSAPGSILRLTIETSTVDLAYSARYTWDMSYAPNGWQHGLGWETIDLSNLMCCYCHEELGVVHQFQLTGLEIWKCGEFSYSEMAHSWCRAFANYFDAWHEEHGYEWQYEERFMTPARREWYARILAEREEV